MRASPLKRGKPLRRKTWMRSRKGNTSYSRRERDMDFMGWARRQPCLVRLFPPSDFAITARESGARIRITTCFGEVQADHLGARGLSQKANDRTCGPMCRRHHQERSDHHGMFFALNQEEARAWRAAAQAHVQLEWRNRQ